MSPLIEKFIGSIIRWALAFVSGWMVQRGIITEADAAVYLSAAAVGGAALAWSFWQKYKSRIKFLTALEAPAGTSEAKIDSMVKAGIGASSAGVVPMILLAAVLSVGVAGCAQGMHGAARAEDVAHDGLMAFDRMLDARCDAGEFTAPTCKELNSLLVPVWDIKNNLNRTIAGGTSAVPVRLDQFQAAIQALIAKVNDLVQGGAKAILLRELNLSIQQTK